MARGLASMVLALALLCAAGPAAAQGEGPEQPPAAEQPAEEAAEAPLAPALLPPDHFVGRIRAVEQLGRQGGEASEQTLFRVLRSDPSHEVRSAAVAALGQLGTPSARRFLVHIARDDFDFELRAQAAALLIGSATAPGPRRAAFQELRLQLSLDTLASLLRTDPDEEVRLAALDALDRRQDFASSRSLVEEVSANDRSEVVREAARSIAEREHALRVSRAVRIAGSALFGASYGITLVGALVAGIRSGNPGEAAGGQAGLRLLLPGAGPIWASWADPAVETCWEVLGFFDAMLQVAGVAMWIAGSVIERRARSSRPAGSG